MEAPAIISGGNIIPGFHSSVPRIESIKSLVATIPICSIGCAIRVIGGFK